MYGPFFELRPMELFPDVLLPDVFLFAASPSGPGFPGRQSLRAYLSFNWPYRRLFRRRMIAVLDGFRGFRVPPPFALLPVGLTG